MATRKNMPSAEEYERQIRKRQENSNMAELAMMEDAKKNETAAAQEGRAGRPRKTKVKISDIRPLQISTHYTYDVKEQVEDVVRRMRRGGIKTASNEELIFIAVSEWLVENKDTFSVSEFLQYRKELE